jgi:membrane-associated protein
MLTQERYDKLAIFYQRYGFRTLLFGRFIPFGVRNGLFITAGMTKMPFLKFITADGLACLISNLTLFTIAYKVGENREVLMSYAAQFNLLIFTIALLLVSFFLFKKFSKPKETET